MRVAVAAAAAVALTLAAVPQAQARSQGLCTTADLFLDSCAEVSGALTDDGVDLTGSGPGGPGGGSGAGPGAGGGSGDDTAGGDACVVNSPGCVVRNPFTVTSLPTPTLSDIASFHPVVGVDHMEPNGWFLTGLDANFYATGGSSIDTGELFDLPASVRFTPVLWRWFYGDGSSATRSTAGAPWVVQGIPEFDATSTSHVYSQPGSYVIDLTIGYHADYRFDGSAWASIDGILWLPANRLYATVGGAKTVLVDEDCNQGPGPGC